MSSTKDGRLRESKLYLIDSSNREIRTPVDNRALTKPLTANLPVDSYQFEGINAKKSVFFLILLIINLFFHKKRERQFCFEKIINFGGH